MDRQKVLIIFGVSILCALLLSWFVLSQTVGAKTEKMRRIVAAVRDLPAGARIKKTDLKFVSVPERDIPRTALFDDKIALDRVLRFPVNANEALSDSKLTSVTGAEGVAAIIEPGKRAVSVPITDVSSAGGLIQPRSRVDVLFTRPGSMLEAVTTTVLEDVMVLSVGRSTEATPATPPAGTAATAAPRPSGGTSATLMVTPDDARKIELAKAQGRISLVLRNPLDHATTTDPEPATAESLDPTFTGMPRKRPGMPKGPNLRDNKAWNSLINRPEPEVAPSNVVKKEEKKEPPKPRWVVDVYRGEKHVQEIFQ